MPRQPIRRERSHLARPSRQARSAATVKRISDATMRLLGKKDFDSISVDEIVRLARTSKGAFYFRFATKADLLRYLAEETFTALSQDSQASFEDERNRTLALEPFLEAFVDHVAAVYVERRNLLRALLQEGRPGGDGVVVALARAGSAESVRMLVQALHQRKAEIRHRDPEIAISAAVTVLGVMLRHVCLYPERLAMFPGLTLDRFRVELRSMLWNYLNSAGPS